MTRRIPLLVLLAGLAYLASSFREKAVVRDFDLASFGRVPVLVNGRVKPLDTVARTSLLSFQGRQRMVAEGRTLTPGEWLADVFFAPEKADTYKHFLIENHEVLDLLGLETAQGDGGKRFSYQQIRAKAPELERQARLADKTEAAVRTPFQRQVITVRMRVIAYLQLKSAMLPPETTDFLADLATFEKALPAGLAAMRAQATPGSAEAEAAKALRPFADRFAYMEQLANLRIVPPLESEADLNGWRTLGGALMESFATGGIHPTARTLAELGDAWRKGDAARFNRLTASLHDGLGQRFSAALVKSDVEARFNAVAPFYRSITLYVGALLLGLISWLRWPETLQRSALLLMLLAFVTTTAGIGARMWLEGRPPVTNLYSSALFVGWGAVLLCLILERWQRTGIGSVVGGVIGLATLVIAHHLSIGGDTLEMMRAVLDSNFWLATHVVVITMGYSATYLAGFLGLVYILRGVLTRSLDGDTATALARMVYGTVCFALLFNLTGTVLGGIWADQSWGRFWGWDPKENGALIIVIWNAVMLHARAGAMVKDRGFMGMAVFGNIVTSWSWFGTNMLGVGLHSYGFMDSAFYALVAFVGSQLLVIALALIPQERWASFRAAKG
jgi:ABC-type transport system involved in cytochrome c biogenesis permease subunit